MTLYDSNRALELLREGAGDAGAHFREGQEDAIRHIVTGQGRLLVVQKTGWGKSFVYFIATKLLREAGEGPALLVSPLLALMRNQIAAAERMGVRAATINSDNRGDWATIEAQVSRADIDILLISPERLANDHFQQEVLSKVGAQLSLLVVDEAHCISDWGHDFRPHYRLIERLARTLPANLRLLATTATANSRVMEDLEQVLGPDLSVSVGALARDSLTLQTLRIPNPADRLAWLAERLSELEGHGIIYTLTVRDAYQVADWLKSRGFAVEAYTGDSGDLRESLEEALLTNQVKALVATTALGMGYDKPDLAFVIHYQTPGSVVAYYQQVGRAGRALEAAYGILLSGAEESDINNWFIGNAFPSRQEVSEVIRVLEEHDGGLSLYELLSQVNISMGRVQKTIQLLSLESPAPVVKQGSKWQLTSSILSDEFWQRAERLTALRQQEQLQMQEYVDLPFGSHMAFLIGALDGDPTGVSPPRLPELPATIRIETTQDAEEFLHRTDLSFKPRKRWPQGSLPVFGLNGSILPNRQANDGMALCLWGDSGWGSLVRDGKYRDKYFADELVGVCVRMIEGRDLQPAPTWVTCMASLRHPELVPNFAERLADALGLPFLPVISQTQERPEQKTMENSSFQAGNLDGSLTISTETLPHGPVLLVDDVVDSGWTMTVAAWLLRHHGSGVVWPLALAQAGYTQ
jgi:ATP-dependent DNA helicase RecQ